MTIVYFAVLAAAVLWVATFWTVRQAHVRSVCLAHYVFGVLLLGFAVALLLRVPLLAFALLALAGFGLRDPRIRETSVRWWDEVREAQAQRRWASSTKDGQNLAPGVRYKLRAAGGHVYLGSKSGRWVTAHPEHAVLVLGPPREGKTSSIVIPTLLAARGPVLVTSTKPDVMAHTMAVRAELGTCWLFDPSGTTPCSPGVQRLHWSPVVACGSWDRAIRLTHDMVATARPADDSRDGGHWSERAAALLAAFLHAAALEGRGMRDVVGWVLRQDGFTPHRILNASGASTASDVLDGIANTAPAEQSGIWSTAAGVLAVYRSEAALALTDTPTFEPAAFVNSRDTVYVVASSHHQRVAAPMIVALLEEIATATFAEASRRVWSNGRLDPPVLYLLDEVANVAPLPALPSIVSEGGGQGLVVLACLQDLSQARQRWKERADGFLSLFGTKMLLRGLGDVATLKAVSELVGDHEVKVVTDTRQVLRLGARPTTNKRGNSGLRVQRAYSTRREPRLPVNLIAEGQPGHALLLRTGKPWTWVRLTPWFDTPPWRDLVSARGAQNGSSSAEGKP
jgi:type IV secretion system protein VirD4